MDSKVNPFSYGPWNIKTAKSHILTSDEVDKVCSELDIPQIPEMVFGKNLLEISHEKGFSIGFKSVDALKFVDNKHDLIKVAIADQWRESRVQCEHIKNSSKPFDWTYTTNYKGTLVDLNKSLSVSQTEDKIDIERLKQKERILFFDEVVLFEDELADNGCAELTVKTRVMPSCMFVLMRFFLRVDGVLCRINDTRLYHDFETTYFIREYTEKEAHFKELVGISSADLSNSAALDQKMKVKYQLNEKIDFSAPN